MPIRLTTCLLALVAITAFTAPPAHAYPQRQSPPHAGQQARPHAGQRSLPRQTEQPRIGSPRSVVARAWTFDPLYGAPKCKSTMCDYVSGEVHFLVAYDSNDMVTDIQMYRYPNPGQPKYWRMLLGFLPAGAIKESCRNFAQTSGLSGPAHACRYRWAGHTILVAQWLRNNPLARGGWIDLGMNYRWLQRF